MTRKHGVDHPEQIIEHIMSYDMQLLQHFCTHNRYTHYYKRVKVKVRVIVRLRLKVTISYLTSYGHNSKLRL